MDPNIGRKSDSWTMIQLAVSASWLYHSVHDEYPISTVNLLSHARAQHLLFTELELSQKHIQKALFAVTDKDNAKMHLV